MLKRLSEVQAGPHCNSWDHGLLVPFVCHDSWCEISVRFDDFHEDSAACFIMFHHVSLELAVFISFNVSFNVALKTPRTTMTMDYGYELRVVL